MNGYLADICRVLYMKGYSAESIVDILILRLGISTSVRSVSRALALVTYPDRDLPNGYLAYCRSKTPEIAFGIPQMDDISRFITELYTDECISIPRNDPFSPLISEGDYSLSLQQPLHEAPISEIDPNDGANGGHRDWLGQGISIWHPKHGKDGLKQYLNYEKRDNYELSMLPDWTDDDR